MTLRQLNKAGPGFHTPAFAVALLLALSPVGALAQSAAPPPPAIQPVPDELEMNKLMWSTMVAIEQANLSGNYSVLRDIAAPGFQQVNDPARLTQIFAPIRASRIDLANTLLLAPTYIGTPQIVEAGVFRVRGYYGLRPTAISFDMYFQWVQGRWRLFGVGITPVPLATIQPGPPAAPVQPTPAPGNNRRNR